MTRIRITGLIVGLLALTALVVAGCGSDDSSAARRQRRQARAGRLLDSAAGLRGRVIPGFQKTADGEGVEFSTSFGASGDQRRAVEGGLPADVVAFSLSPT